MRSKLENRPSNIMWGKLLLTICQYLFFSAMLQRDTVTCAKSFPHAPFKRRCCNFTSHSTCQSTYLPSLWQILTSTSVTTVNHPWPLFELSFSKSKCKNSLPLILSSVAESLFIGHTPLLFLHAVSLQTYWYLTELIGHTFPWR